jgi:hypothetical protein
VGDHAPPVRATEASTVSLSSGFRVATSITAASIPAGQQIGGLERIAEQGAPAHQRQVTALAHDEAAVERQGPPSSSIGSLGAR